MRFRRAFGLAVIVVSIAGCGDAKIASSAMAPTLKPGETVKINYGAYTVDGPQRWDVVAFEPPDAPGSLWAFRVVGMPGESVSFAEGGITLAGNPIELPPHLSNITYVSIDNPAFKNVGSQIQSPYVVPNDHYFLLGDNSPNANDSRFLGGIPRSNILGRISGK